MKDVNLDSLVVFDRLVIGPVMVEKKRARASYELTLSRGKIISKELIYSYTSEVFDTSRESLNLASMMLSQVALNYGLFCKRIVFDGVFEDADKRFILDMMENTSREIYVNKFLLPNVYLKPPYDRMIAEKRKSYTAAEITFVDSAGYGGPIKWEHRDTERNRYVVLSSGGKDSLLSYGLLKELNKEVHPVFINESGRHWYTALNAFKHLSVEETNTHRVWCNSDRIFNWMLQYMPFIKDNYPDIRADIYPVRLWTVAVFVFGALPVAQKVRAGNIIVGNEYDTTMKSSFRGITHYQELYDQSRYFDRALTRYYTKKGWNAYQFSLLRSLSELLILKILAGRYPELQKHQVSCHAAHLSEGRVYPCGKCEKCRRIIAMLEALGFQAENCGYSPDQIRQALKAFGEKGVKQLGTDAEHLVHLARKKKLIDGRARVAKNARSHPYVMKMRFDAERSRLNEVPRQLYQRLTAIYSEYTDGAAMRQARAWVDFDLPGAFRQADPYPFEVPRATRKKDHRNPPGYHWHAHTWVEIEKRLSEVDTAILPCGSIEQHGPHLPLDVDYFDSVYLADRVAEACSHPKPLVLPGIPYGVAYHHEDFKGTVSISNNALSLLVYDIGMSLARNGIRKLIILNGHGDNSPTLLYAAQMINRDTGIFVCVESGETSDTDLYSFIETPNDIHAGEIETSTTLAVRPEVVRMNLAVNETLNFGSSYLDYTSERGVAWYVRTKFISGSGIMGNPTLASARKGKKFWEIMIAHLVRFVEEVKRSKLEDLYQRKY
jgi:creatinine amidohydrolase/Fe(II)-dependent formamide hydrolase-like protein/7-cyano-7-deazaguanine synthase in queuosine biosynthesis